MIETERLLITRLTPDMAATLQQNSVDEDNQRFVPDEVWHTTAEAEEVLQYLISQYGAFEGPLVYAVLVKATGENIGYVQLCPIEDGCWEAGYHIAKPYTGNGYATEALRAFLPVMAEAAGLSRIYGICLSENKASLAVMKKCGFETEFSGIGPYQGAEREIVRCVWRCPGRERTAMRIETDRLILRELTMEDFEPLYEILSDTETMRHYPAPFTAEKVRSWITRNRERYEKDGFGLWAVVRRDTGECIGDCGLTLQDIDGETLPEIGYHIHKTLWRRGYGKEAARAVRDWAFANTPYDTLYSYMKYTNAASYGTAIANGMKKIKEYPDPKNTLSYAYAITRAEWQRLRQAQAEPNPQSRQTSGITYREEKLSPEEYIDFLKRTDLGSQYPKERFTERIGKLVKNVSISLTARNEENKLVGVLFGLTDFCYWLYVTDLGVDKAYERQGIGTRLMRTAHTIAGGEKDIAVYLIANEHAIPFYEKLGMKKADDVMQYNHIEWTKLIVK